jgi:hypothetical protein
MGDHDTPVEQVKDCREDVGEPGRAGEALRGETVDVEGGLDRSLR